MNYQELIDNMENEKIQKLSEPVLQLETTVEKKIAYLKSHLHPSTVAYLEPLDFMFNQQFPYDEYDAHWYEEPDEDNPVVSDEIIKHDREVWLNAI